MCDDFYQKITHLSYFFGVRGNRLGTVYMYTIEGTYMYIPQCLKVVEDNVSCLGPVMLGVLDQKVSKPVYRGLVLL